MSWGYEIAIQIEKTLSFPCWRNSREGYLKVTVRWNRVCQFKRELIISSLRNPLLIDRNLDIFKVSPFNSSDIPLAFSNRVIPLLSNQDLVIGDFIRELNWIEGDVKVVIDRNDSGWFYADLLVIICERNGHAEECDLLETGGGHYCWKRELDDVSNEKIGDLGELGVEGTNAVDCAGSLEWNLGDWKA